MKINSDRIVAFSAMAVGIGSLVVIGYQTHLMRAAQYASALPYLMIAINANEGGVNIDLSNAGIGPAFIEEVQVHYQGRDSPGDPHDFLRSRHPELDSILSVNTVKPGRVIPAGATLQMVGVDGERATPSTRAAFLSELLHLFEVAEVPRSWYAGVGAADGEKAVIDIVYSSAYGERWRLRSDESAPRRL